MTKLLIDTDIGTDVDDALALMYAIKAGIDIPLITTVHGDTLTRAYLAKKITIMMGKDIPVAAGLEKPLVHPYVFWTGLEGKRFLQEGEKYPVQKNAVDAIAQCIYEHKNDIAIASIAPMTNLAAAFQRYPDLENYVNCIYSMGNAILCDAKFHLNYRAHNYKVDPHAVDIVFATKIPKTIVTTEVCKQLFLTKEELATLGGRGDQLLDYVYTTAMNWMDFIKYDVAYLYDPLVVHHHLDDLITNKITYEKVKITASVNHGFKELLMANLLGDEQ